MPAPGVSELATMTLRSRTQELADSVTRNNALLTKLDARGRIREFVGGGRTIMEEIVYAQNQTYKRYSGYEVLNIAPSSVFTAAEYVIRQIAVAISISGLEQLQNAGDEQSIDLLASRVENAEDTFRNGLSYDIYSDGALANQIGGLQAAIPADPTTGVYGTINRANWDFWQSRRFRAVTDGGAAISPANIYQYFTQLYTRCRRGTDRPDLIVADNNIWTTYNQALHAIQRNTKLDGDTAKAGFMTLDFMGSEVVLDGGFQGVDDDATLAGIPLGGVPDNTAWMLNSRFLSWRPHKNRNMEPLDPDRFSVNQDAMVRLIGWAGNLTARGMLFHGQLNNN